MTGVVKLCKVEVRGLNLTRLRYLAGMRGLGNDNQAAVERLAAELFEDGLRRALEEMAPKVRGYVLPG